MLKRKSYTRVTLALDILSKVDEGEYLGFHKLCNVKHQIDLFDEISLFGSDETIFLSNDPKIPQGESNLCLKAVDLIKKNFSISRNVKIEIKKNIPLKSGLAGGSSNVATLLEMLNEFWGLKIPKDELMRLSRKIGMDVPYYFVGGTAMDDEVGNIKKIETNFKLDFVLVTPDFGVSTKDAYSWADCEKTGKNEGYTKKVIEKLEKDDLAFARYLHNDFEDIVFPRYPELEEIKLRLSNLGCSAVLTGSGSTIIGIVKDRKHAENVSRKIGYKSIIAKTR